MCIYLCVYIRTATMHETYFSVDVSLNIDKLMMNEMTNKSFFS